MVDDGVKSPVTRNWGEGRRQKGGTWDRVVCHRFYLLRQSLLPVKLLLEVVGPPLGAAAFSCRLRIFLCTIPSKLSPTGIVAEGRHGGSKVLGPAV